jgi:hypothetical protein
MHCVNSTEKMKNNSDFLQTLNEETKNFEFQNKKEKPFKNNIFLDLEELSSESDELDNYEQELNEELEVILFLTNSRNQSLRIPKKI